MVSRPATLLLAVTSLIARIRSHAGGGGTALILAYHNVVPDDCPAAGDRSLHIALGRFLAHLDVLERIGDIVPLERLLAGDSSNTRPLIALTFDDAYAGAIRLALPELQRRGLPATVFVAPGLLGGQTWWDALAHAWLSDSNGRLRERLLASGAQADQVRAIAQQEGIDWRPVLPEHAIATAAQLRSASYPGLTLGAHTWNHVNLARWNPVWHPQELDAPMRWLATEFPRESRPWLALPFGLGSSEALEAAVRAGYERCFRVEGGWRRRATVATREPRLNVPAGATPNRLLLRMSIAPFD